MPTATIKAVEHLPAPRPIAWLFPIVVLLASLTATYFLWRISSREIQQLAQTQLNDHAKEITGQILNRLQDNENILRGGDALFSVRGDGLTRQEWQQYASSLKLDISNPGILGFGFSAWVPQAQMTAHLNTIRAEGFPKYTISPAGERSFYSPIIWLEPFNEMNRRAFGYDMYAESIRQAAMERARDTGKTSISDKVILAQEGKQDIQPGILMYVPCYRRDMPIETVEQRHVALRGFVYSPIRMKDFVHAVIANMPEQLDVAIYSGQEVAPERLLFRSQQTQQRSLPTEITPTFFTSRTIEAYGSTWNLTFSGLPSFEQQYNPSKSLIILLVGSLASLLLSILALMQTNSRRQALVIARQAANELLTQQKFALHMQQTPLAVIEWNNQLQVTVWNRAAETIFGYSADEALGAPLSFLFAADEQEAISSTLRTILLEKQNVTGNYTNITKDGRAIKCEWYSVTLVDQRGDVLGAATLAHDVTAARDAEAERDRLESQNRQLQKADSLSRMAGAIAHHFNNQLQAVMISLELLHDSAEEYSKPTEIRSIISMAIHAAEKAAEVSKLLLTYLAKVPVTLEPLDLSDACRKVQALWLASKPDNVGFSIDLPDDGPIINSNASQLQQLITNLVTNAWEACENDLGSVTLTITTEEKEAIATTSCYPVDMQLTDRKYACIAISDTGCGIPREMFDQLFDPFYSTKFTGRGMGLSVVLGIVRAHQGVITVESQVSGGSIFRVYLPITEKAIRKKVTPVVTGNHSVGHGTILVVEDVPLIREMIATMIKTLGYTVLQAEDGEQALELFDQHQKEIVCVISDIVMPRMDGWETLKAVRRRSPGIPVIFASGYTEAHLLKESHDEMPNIFLEKPFHFAKLRDALAIVLSQMAAKGSKVDPL